MGALGNGAGESAYPFPRNLKNMTSYAALLRKTKLKISALATATLAIGLKCREKNANFFVCAFGTPQSGRLL